MNDKGKKRTDLERRRQKYRSCNRNFFALQVIRNTEHTEMKRLGMDIGTSTIKVVVLEDQVIKYKNIRKVTLWARSFSIKRNFVGRGMCPKGVDGNVRDRSKAQAVLWQMMRSRILAISRRLRKASVIRCRRQEASSRSEAREPVLSQTLKNKHRSLRSTSTVPGERALFLKTRCPAWD